MVSHRSHQPAGVSPRIPVVVLVVAATAVPVELRPLDRTTLDLTLHVFDVLANMVGYVPIGLVLAELGVLRAVAAAALIATCAEAGQFVMMHRFPSAIDVPVNVAGAVLGVAASAYWRIGSVGLVIDRWKALAAAVMAAGIVFIAWAAAGEAPNARGASLPGTVEAHWKLDASQGRVAPDSSGNGLQGKSRNEPKYVGGVIGGAVALDGKTDSIHFGHSSALRLIGSMTVSAWINSASYPGDDAAIVSSFDGLGYQLDTTVDRGPRTIGFKIADACGELMARYGATPLELNTWYHVAGVYDADAGTMDVYLNGQPDNGFLLGSVTRAQRSSRAAVYVGRRSDREGFEFAGSIDDVRIHSRALTNEEIAADMYGLGGDDTPPPTAEATGTAGSLAAWLKTRAGTPCPGMSDDEDARLPGAAATLGALVAVACLGLWPAAGSALLLAASVCSGLLLLPAAAPTLPEVSVWMAPLLSLVGGASVVVSVRGQNGGEP